MSDYKLSIELQFSSQADAEKIMSACEPLATQTAAEEERILAEEITKQINGRTTEASKLAGDIEARKAELIKALGQARQMAASIEGKVKEAEAALNQMHDTFDRINGECQVINNELLALLSDSNNKVKQTQDKVGEFDRYVNDAVNLAEAANLMRDMVSVKHSIVTGGTVKLLKKAHPVEERYQQVKGWQFQRE